MRMRLSLHIAMLAFAACAAARPASALSDDSPEAAARRYLAAEAHFDLPTLNQVLAPGFVEISPLGEVDERAAVLSFYAPEKKTAAPPMDVSDLVTRVHGDTAFVTGRIAFKMGAATQTMTVGMATVKAAHGWRLLSSQYTRLVPKPTSSSGH